jgi:hypothetical protein
MAKVRAIDRGYYGDIVRSEGDVFVFTGPGPMPKWVEPADDDGDELDELAPPATAKPAKAATKGKPAAKAKPAPEPEPFGDAPEPVTIGKGNGVVEALGGLEPDWMPPQAVTE